MMFPKPAPLHKKARKPIPFRSTRRQREMVARRILVAKILRERPVCEFPGCHSPSTAVHEIVLRSRGGSILDESNCLAVDGYHHSWLHHHPREATNLGMIRSRFAVVDTPPYDWAQA